VARSEPDGLTLFFTSNGALTITPHLVSKSPFQPLSDFAPITRVAQVDAVLVTHPSIPATDFRSFLALVKAAPGKFAFASSGNGGPTHLAGELLKRDAGIELLHVPYKGDSPALVDIMGGAIAFGIPVIPSAAPFIKSGRLRALASFGEHRLPDFPDVPTIAESGCPSVSAGAWYAVVAPAKTPAAIVTLLNERISATLADPEVARKLVAAGMQPSAASTPGATASYIKSEYDKWGALIRSARIEPIN
jgi:tripartite-type tricarboxylate transporter receptor subunit TctC